MRSNARSCRSALRHKQRNNDLEKTRAAGNDPAARSTPRQYRAYCAGVAASSQEPPGQSASTDAVLATADSPVLPFPIRPEKNWPSAPNAESPIGTVKLGSVRMSLNSAESSARCSAVLRALSIFPVSILSIHLLSSAAMMRSSPFPPRSFAPSTGFQARSPGRPPASPAATRPRNQRRRNSSPAGCPRRLCAGIRRKASLAPSRPQPAQIDCCSCLSPNLGNNALTH